MNKQNFPMAPDENQIEEFLTKIQPIPSGRFHQKIKEAAWRVDGGKQGVTEHFRFKMTFAIITLATLMVLFATPQGRAWAQEVFQFFRKVSFTTIPISEEEKKWINAPVEQYELPLVPVILPTLAPEMTSLTQCQALQKIQSYACQVAYTEAKLGMELKEFPKTPEGWIFKKLNFDVASKTASFIYSHYSEHGADFVLRQGTGKFQNNYWSIVPAEKVQPVKIGQFDGEYVRGTFTLREGDNAWRWEDDDSIQRLAWSEAERWYYIEIWAPSPGHISRDQLVELAASLENSPVEVADPLNPDSLSSIADAETYSGLDLKAPTILPLGFEFSHARYFPFNHEVHLHYKYNEDLVIYVWAGTPDDFDALAKIYKNHEIVEVGDKQAFYGVPEAVSQYESSYLLLAWHDENLNYRIYFYFDPSWGGGMLNQAKMIAIAESMGDINDYKRNDSHPYEFVAIYENALGFDIREFPTVPEGWSFSDVSANPDCIFISYSGVKENGQLAITQCKATTQALPLSNIPSTAIQDVNIGKIKGQYIVGNFDYDSTGMVTWNMSSPMRQLRWQEDGIWMQVTLTGDSIVLYDKEALISYAESLR